MIGLIQGSLKARVWVLLGVGALIVGGTESMLRLSVDAVPDITGIQVMVNTKTGALDPQAIEATVTFPVENQLAGVPGVAEIRSITKYGLSQVIVVFEDNTNIYFARQVVAERLQSLELPEGLRPELGPVSTGLGEVLMYTVSARPGSPLAALGEEERLRQLRFVQDRMIAPGLKRVRGVAEIDTNGGFSRMIEVAVDPAKLRQHGVPLERLVMALADIGLTRGGGYVEQEGRRIVVRSFAGNPDPQELAGMPVQANALEGPVRVGTLARVGEGSDFRVGAATADGVEAVLGTVLMRIGANSREVAGGAEVAIAGLALPPDVEVKILYSRSHLVNATINTVAKNLVEGGLLVIVILVLVLGNWRAALIVASAIPLSMLAAFTGMRYLEIPASLMSLGAIDFGLLVDGSVVMIENVVRRLEERGRQTPGPVPAHERMALVLEAGREVARPVFAGLAVIMIVYVPVLSLTGIEGKLFRPMAITVLFTLAASLVVALVLMPVLAYYVLKGHRGAHEGRVMARVNAVYAPLLDRILSLRAVWVFTPVVLVFAFAGILFLRLGSEFVPSLDEGDLIIGLVRPADISLEESVAQQIRSEKVIRTFGEVEAVFSRIGTPESATDPMGVNFADTFVMLKKDRALWPEIDGRRRTKDELYRALSAAIDRKVPGQEPSATQPIEMRFNEMLEGSRADVSLRIFGPDLEVLLEAVEIAQREIEKIPGVSEVSLDALSALRRSPVIDFRLEPARISAAGVHPEDVKSVFETAMAGRTVGYFFGQDRRIPVRVILDQKARQNLELVLTLPVELPGGQAAPLGRFARLERREQVTTISRVGGRRYAGVAIYMEESGDVERFVNQADQALKAALHLPEGYTLEWGGQFKNLVEARGRLLAVVPLTMVLILFILWRSFDSVRQALLIFSCVPFAATGGVTILWLRGMNFSVSASIGFIALSGIAVLNGIVLVSFLARLRAEGAALRDAVREGALSRLRPVLITALVATLGFLPMAFNTGPGAEVQRPLATVVIGGLVSSTILTLLILPTLYARVEEWFERRRLAEDLRES